MTTWYIEFSAPLPTAVSEEVVEEHVEDVLLELDGLDGITDADMLINYAERTVMFSLYIEAADHAEALPKVATSMRTAIHAAGGGTPGWEKMIAKMLDSARYDIQKEDAGV